MAAIHFGAPINLQGAAVSKKRGFDAAQDRRIQRALASPKENCKNLAIIFTPDERDAEANQSYQSPLSLFTSPSRVEISRPLHPAEVATKYRHEANQLALMGNFSEARSLLGSAMRMDPDRMAVYAEISAQTFLCEENLFSAVRLAEQAVRSDPNYVFGHWTLARALLSFGELRQAIYHFEKSHQLATNDKDMLAIEDELQCAQKHETEIEERENEQPSDQPRAKMFNGRWYGDVLFYETGVKVDHGMDEAWLLIKPGRKLCCAPSHSGCEIREIPE